MNQQATVALRLLRSAETMGVDAAREASICARLSTALVNKNRTAALHYLQRAMRLLQQDHQLALGPAILNLARMYARQANFAESHQLFRQYLDFHPKDNNVRSEFASLLLAGKSVSQALAQFEALPAAYMDQRPEIRKDYAMALMSIPERIAEGFALYDARLVCVTRGTVVPVDLKGLPVLTAEQLRTNLPFNVIVLDEQGIGDTLQFYRYVLQLAHQHPQVQVSFCPKHSCTSFFELGPQADAPNLRIIHQQELPIVKEDFLVKTYLCSLPRLLGITEIEDTTKHQWIKAPLPAKLTQWQFFVQTRCHRRKKIGFCMRGTINSAVEKNMDFAVVVEQCFLPFYEDADFVCLNRAQDYPHEVERADLYDFVHFLVLDSDEPNYAHGCRNPFADTMALIAQMDLVISVDTSIAHLAACMGKPVWLLLGALSDWRWDHEPQPGRTPWYQHMRMFRAKVPNVFHEVLPEVQAELREWLSLQEC